MYNKLVGFKMDHATIFIIWLSIRTLKNYYVNRIKILIRTIIPFNILSLGGAVRTEDIG